MRGAKEALGKFLISPSESTQWKVMRQVSMRSTAKEKSGIYRKAGPGRICVLCRVTNLTELGQVLVNAS